MEDALEQAVKFNPLRPRAHLHYSLVHALRQEPSGKWVWKHQRPKGQEELEKEPEDKEKEELVTRFPQLWDDVARIKAPTLLFHGTESNVLHREDAENLQKAMADATLISVTGAGHTVQGDKPRVFAAELTRFLDRVL